MRIELPTLSIRQPWAWAIVNGFKDIENRDWPTRVRGPILIHAGVKEEKDDIDFVMETITAAHGGLPEEHEAKYLASRALGAIVGGAHITGCVDSHLSDWFFGKYGFVLERGKPCEPVPMKGRLGFFKSAIDWRDLGRQTEDSGG